MSPRPSILDTEQLIEDLPGSFVVTLLPRSMSNRKQLRKRQCDLPSVATDSKHRRFRIEVLMDSQMTESWDLPFGEYSRPARRATINFAGVPYSPLKKSLMHSCSLVDQNTGCNWRSAMPYQLFRSTKSFQETI